MSPAAYKLHVVRKPLSIGVTVDKEGLVTIRFRPHGGKNRVVSLSEEATAEFLNDVENILLILGRC